MKKRMIGNLEVSEIGMGCMGFSHGYGKVPEEGYALDAIRKAYETGCTFFDTAEVYGDIMFYPGHNELLVGKAISGFRKDVVLATKLCRDIGQGARHHACRRRAESLFHVGARL